MTCSVQLQTEQRARSVWLHNMRLVSLKLSSGQQSKEQALGPSAELKYDMWSAS